MVLRPILSLILPPRCPGPGPGPPDVKPGPPLVRSWSKLVWPWPIWRTNKLDWGLLFGSYFVIFGKLIIEFETNSSKTDLDWSNLGPTWSNYGPFGIPWHLTVVPSFKTWILSFTLIQNAWCNKHHFQIKQLQPQIHCDFMNQIILKLSNPTWLWPFPDLCKTGDLWPWSDPILTLSTLPDVLSLRPNPPDWPDANTIHWDPTPARPISSTCSGPARSVPRSAHPTQQYNATITVPDCIGPERYVAPTILLTSSLNKVHIHLPSIFFCFIKSTLSLNIPSSFSWVLANFLFLFINSFSSKLQYFWVLDCVV